MAATGQTLAAFETRLAALDYQKHLEVCAGRPPAGAGFEVRGEGLVWVLDVLWDNDSKVQIRWARLCGQVVDGEQHARSQLDPAGAAGRRVRRTGPAVGGSARQVRTKVAGQKA